MATKKPKTVLFRRKRQKKTNYKTRLRLLLSRKPRLVVRLTNTKVVAQVVSFNPKGDTVLAAVDSSSLKKHGWNYSNKNIPACYLTGLLVGKVAKGKNVGQVILDSGSKSTLHGGKVFAVLKGAIDSGLEIAYGDENIFPSQERLSGEHIKQHAEKLKANKEAYEKYFAQYLKNKVSPESITQAVEQVKNKILG